MTITPKTLKELLYELHMINLEDQDSPGCNVTLAEWLSIGNVEELECFLQYALRSYLAHCIEEGEPEEKDEWIEQGADGQVKNLENAGWNWGKDEYKQNLLNLLEE
jgi:hypothetical protein